MAAATFAEIAERIAATGLLARGGFHPAPDDAVPPLEDGRAVRTVILIGNAGPAMWRRFRPFLDANPNLAHPLNTWVGQTIGPLAAALGARVVYTHDGPPFHPFVRWAQRAEPVRVAPITLLIHPLYGLWHAYRAALLFAGQIPLPKRDDRPSPCESCGDKPCLKAGPVDPHHRDGFDAARRACPVGRDFTYGDEQSAFHQDAFLRRR